MYCRFVFNGILILYKQIVVCARFIFSRQNIDKKSFAKTYHCVCRLCPHCEDLLHKTLADSILLHELYTNFIIEKVNVESELGKKMVKDFDIKGLPTLMIFSTKKVLKKTFVGFKDAHEIRRIY